jgi:hypothetical protein
MAEKRPLDGFDEDSEEDRSKQAQVDVTEDSTASVAGVEVRYVIFLCDAM